MKIPKNLKSLQLKTAAVLLLAAVADAAIDPVIRIAIIPVQVAIIGTRRVVAVATMGVATMAAPVQYQNEARIQARRHHQRDHELLNKRVRQTQRRSKVQLTQRRSKVQLTQ